MRSGFPLHPTPRRAVYRARGSRAPVRRRAPRRRRGLAPLLQPPPAHARRAARPGTLPLPAAPPAPGPCRRQKRGRGPAPSPSAPAMPARFQKAQSAGAFPDARVPEKSGSRPVPCRRRKKRKGAQPLPRAPRRCRLASKKRKAQALFPTRASPKRADRARSPLAAAADFRGWALSLRHPPGARRSAPPAAEPPPAPPPAPHARGSSPASCRAWTAR